MFIVDTDIHAEASRERMLDFMPEPWRSRLADGGTFPGGPGYWNPNGVNRSDAVTPAGERIENHPDSLGRYHLDRYHIDYGIINSGDIHIGLSPEPDFAAAWCSALNDVFLQDWLPADPRLRHALLISPADPVLAAQEIERLGSHPGVVQVLMPSAAPFGYGHRFYYPIYAAAVAQGLPVAIHPGAEGRGIAGKSSAAGLPASYFEWHSNLVGSYIAHLASLLGEGVFQKFPGLKFVLVEGGVSWLPPLLWRLDKNWKSLRMTVPWLDRPPSAVVADHILLTTQPIEEPERTQHLHEILAMFPAERMLLFSTDFPHWDGDTPDFTLRMIPEAMREDVMWRNAAKLYGLPLMTHAS